MSGAPEKQPARARTAASAAPATPGPGGLLTARLTPGRIGLFVLLAVVGAATGIAGGLVVALWPPAGLLLALLATLGLFVGSRLLMHGPIGVGAAALGWLGVLVVFVSPRPEGDNLYAPATGTYVYMLGGIVAAVICATLQGSTGGPYSAYRSGR
ncbi:DUF6113 family protein [Streptomyces bambusae]|uniref:DUF6113 family protein n=1 Tax=Streptomyces bambusae TaxID=1550616 RepID=UPI001CFE270A|nr:DUF6113 family protein [Streptomyces bambusae]MCB5166929.1 DUF6113 family protein [Streptomyces bambusae]